MKRKWLISIRKSEKKTQEQMAKLWEISNQSYRYYEYGIRTPDVERAKKFAEISKFNHLKFYE